MEKTAEARAYISTTTADLLSKVAQAEADLAKIKEDLLLAKSAVESPKISNHQFGIHGENFLVATGELSVAVGQICGNISIIREATKEIRVGVFNQLGYTGCN